MPAYGKASEPVDDDATLKAVTENHDRAKAWLEPYHEAFADNYDFHFHRNHYDDLNANERDRRRAKPRGRQMSSQHRHKLAQVMKQALYISTEPVDDATDPDAAARVKWFLDYEIKAPVKHFKRTLRRAVSLALATNAGAIGLKIYHDLGPHPEIRPHLLDPRNVLWTPGWQDPDDDTCPWVIIEELMSVAAIEAMADKDLGKWAWKNTEDLKGGSAAAESGRAGDPSRPLRDIAASNSGPGPDHSDDNVRVWFCWYRFDHSTEERDTEETRELDDAQRYMACGECGLTDYTKDGKDLPDVGDPCPACAELGKIAPMKRVNREMLTEEALAYREGKRLAIMAPDERRLFYNKGWPETVGGRPIRNVPIAFFKCYDIPLEPWGSCDTEWNYTYQVISNALERRMYETLSQTGGVIITSWDGLWSADGTKPFQFSDRPVSLARTKNMGQPQVQFFEPRGAVGESLPYMNFLNGQFRADMGISDLGLTAQQSKDIPVGTVRALTQSGEIPVDDMAEQVREVLSSFWGVWYDLKRGLMTERQMVRLRGEDGAEAWQAMRGEELPEVDVLVGSGPVWDEFDADRAEKFRALLSPPPGVPPEVWIKLWPMLAEVANVPQEMIAKAQKLLQPPAPVEGAPSGAGMPQPPTMGGPGAPPAGPNGSMPNAVARRMQGNPFSGGQRG